MHARTAERARWWSLFAGLVIVLVSASHTVAAEPVALRVESLTVAPASQPLVFVAVQNLKDEPYEGTVTLSVPKEWRLAAGQQEVSLAAGQRKRIPFTVERGVNRDENSYPVHVVAIGAGTSVKRKQSIVCASAPYFKPTVDGDPSEWKDAIPVTFLTDGKKTVISTYWNRRQFSLLVTVEEDKRIDLRENGPFDAVQFAIAPRGTKTGTSPSDVSERHEFLLAGTGTGDEAKCFLLIEPGRKLTEAATPRPLEPLVLPKAKVAVSRQGKLTHYECSIPFRLMRKRIRPSEGREFYLSVCVHDADGTGVRDWGQAAGLWPTQRNRLAWCRWKGDQWGDQPPFDGKLEWGLCSSKY